MRVISLSSRVCIGALVAVLVGTAGAEEAPSGTSSLLVKLRSDGPHAIHACAASSFETGTPLARASEDGSDSLDRLAQQLGVRSVRAVFRRPDGSSLAAQRQRLRGRLERAGERRPKRGRHSAPAPDLSHVYRLELPQGTNLEQAAARFRADPHVAYAQPNFRVDYDAAPIDDPFVTSAGSWGQSYPDQWGLHAIDAPRAWEASLGAGVVIAVVDTGVDLEHEDLAGNLWIHPGEDLDGNGRIDPEERNGIDDDDNGFVDDFRGWDFQGSPEAPASEGGDADPQDENGHGTHVAGIAAARGGNGIGMSGVAPRATVMPVRIFPPTGGAETDLDFRGVLYAILNGAAVINASFSCGRV
jgi:subtilisin family serine protease